MKWIWSRRSPLPAAEQVSLPQLQPHHSPQAGTAGLAGTGRVREAGGRGSFGKCSRFRAPPTCSTLRRSARSTSPRCRRRCSRPGAATQRSHSVRGEEGTDRSPSWPGAPGGTASSTPSPTQRGNGELCTFTHHLNVESPKHAHGEYSSEPVSHVTQVPAMCSVHHVLSSNSEQRTLPVLCSPCPAHFMRLSAPILHEFPMSQSSSAARPWLAAPLSLPFPPEFSNPSLYLKNLKKPFLSNHFLLPIQLKRLV